ncbi:hypothetical protein Poli38472_002672 [Pythium oligandrum]|uniref:Dynamin N-terminal domain-containing protein n=1 Tax=Pythium oligandrum TaxID=41045 RepID=A0A8K1CJ80_PYTOL|nr:hypothetical protein Poli38472_002672 [Pythium oligandrum]|eukprot:TMW63731.1 hypothetical protein Poli38472_002672 [Pythium oligandrum]
MAAKDARHNALKGDSNALGIMNQVHALYTNADEGLSTLARRLGLTIHPPRRKVNVLIIGNHSAGKSSFVNWYIGDQVQRTGVAIETQGFTIVTSGSKKTLAPIKGESSVMLYPYLEPLKERFGKPLIENLNTCVSTSTKREFPMVDFIDSPGLVDGDISYPFDVNEAIVHLADSVDLIFVFMDPMGQALCSRTMNVVKMLNQKHFDKMKYYLTKADTVHNPKELMKLMVQITQNIKQHINNQHGLEIPAIWLPESSGGKRPGEPVLNDEVNQISEVCATIEKAIHQKVQDNLSQVEKDCHAVVEKTNELLAKDEMEIAAKKSRQLVAVFFAVCAWTIPLVTFLTLVGEYKHYLPEAILEAEYVSSFIDTLYDGIRPLLLAPEEKLGPVALVKFFGISVVLFLVLNGISKFTHARASKFVLQKREVISKWRRHEQIAREVLHRRQELFLEYVRAYTAVEDM